MTENSQHAAGAATFSAETSLAQDIRAGLLGLAIAVGCLFLIIPVVHTFAAMSGPAVGGFFAAARVQARGRHAVTIGLTIGVGEAIVAWTIAGVLMAIGVVGRDTTTLLIVGGLDLLVFLYSSALGTLGAFFGGRG